MKKSAKIAFTVWIWVVAIMWFATGYIYGTINALDPIMDWAKEKWNKLTHGKREA